MCDKLEFLDNDVCGTCRPPTLEEIVRHFSCNKHASNMCLDMLFDLFLGRAAIPRTSKHTTAFTQGSAVPAQLNLKLTWGAYVEHGMQIMFALLLLFRQGIYVRWGPGPKRAWFPSECFDLSKSRTAVISYHGCGYYNNMDRVCAAWFSELPSEFDDPLWAQVSKWDGLIKHIPDRKGSRQVLLPLGRKTAGYWPVLCTQFTAEGWLKIKELCDWEIMRREQVTFLVCPYQLVDKTEVWCLYQTLDLEGHLANNADAEQRRIQQRNVSPRQGESSPGAFEVMD